MVSNETPEGSRAVAEYKGKWWGWSVPVQTKMGVQDVVFCGFKNNNTTK